MCEGHTSWKPDLQCSIEFLATQSWNKKQIHTHTPNTIFGTQFHRIPASSGHIVSDLSVICSRPIDIPSRRHHAA